MSAEDTTIQQPPPPPAAPAAEPAPAPSPAEPAADGQEAATSQEADGEAQDGERQLPDRDQKGRFKGVQPRIDELTRARHEAEREAAYWRGVATQGKAQPSAEQPAAPTKPTPEQFSDYAEFVEALTEWKADQRVSQALSQREADAARKAQEQTRASTWAERQTAARTAMPDYDEVVGGSTTPIAPHVSEALLESEHGPALAYHFAKHPTELERINGMSVRDADRAIGRLEARLASGTTPPAPTPAPVKTSNAPKPATPLGTQGRSTQKDPSQMGHEEYRAYRKAQGARWAN